MSFILAKILGLYFLAIGIAFFINTNRFKETYNQISKDENFLFMSGIVALLIGSVIVSIHNYWILGWPLVITILGWWGLLKGFLLIAYPNFIHFFSFIKNRSNLFYKIMSFIYVAMGVFLIYKGWDV